MDQKELEELMKKERANSFAVYNHMEIVLAERDHAVFRLTIRPESKNPYGMVHGGALVTLADTVAGTCACSKYGNTCVTTNSTMEYLRPGTAPWVRCVAVATKIGRTLSVVRVELTDSQDRLVATGTYTFCMMNVGDDRLRVEPAEKTLDKDKGQC